MNTLIPPFSSLHDAAIYLRGNLDKKKPILIFAHNGVGKTRLSGEFKNIAKKTGNIDTLYFNAFTEDLFAWDNDIENDTRRVLRMNKDSRFFAGIEEQDMENKIRPLLSRYASFNFLIDYVKWEVNFIREEIIDGKAENNEFIKISRGEENIFIWCFFLAVAELAIDQQVGYQWVKNIYVDDPVSSLDENNAIAVACHLVELMKKKDIPINFVISTHHCLFFNVVFNELGRGNRKSFYLHYNSSNYYTLQETNDTPFFHHVALLSELKEAMDSGNIKTYHFNILRGILEKTSSFLGYNSFGKCLHGFNDETLLERALNLLSHGRYSLFDPVDMNEDNKQLFKQILNSFINKYGFQLPFSQATGSVAPEAA